MSDVAGDLLRAGRFQEAAGERDAAIQIYQRAILAAPLDPAGYIHLGELLYVSGFVAEARGIHDIGLKRIPRSPLLHWARCMTTLPMVPASEAETQAALADFSVRLSRLPEVSFASAAAIEEAGRAVGLRTPFFLPYLGEVDPALMARVGRLACDVMAANQPARTMVPRVRWRPEEKIRIGVVSGLFRRHSVWRMPTCGWVTALDRSRFTLLGYHTRNERDEQTVAASRLFDRFHSGWAPLPDWFGRIAADAPHVLIYPELGADQTSYQLAALPLAPVRCTTWGQPVTSGLPTVSHFLSSEAMEPPGADAQYTETLVRLPGLGTVLDPDAARWSETLPEGDSWAQFGLPDDAVRILCCQATQKYLPRYDSLFPLIARAVPRVRFVFIAQNERNRDIFWRRLYLAFHAFGLSGEAHCVFLPPLGQAAFSAVVRDAHIHLDTIGWSGCNTTVDALGHGVPTVTLPGSSMRARHGLALLEAMGVTDTVVDSVEAIVDQVVRLAGDAAYRMSVTDRLRAARDRLFGDTAPVRALEAFLTTEVARHCADA